MKVILKNFPQLAETTEVEFRSEVPEEMLCKMCRALPSELWIATCSDGFCSECLNQIQDGSLVTCPIHKTCVQRQQVKRDSYVWKSIQQLVTKCRWSDEGCMEEGDLQSMQYHFLKCTYKLVTCPECCKKLPRQDLSSHFVNDCPKRNALPSSSTEEELVHSNQKEDNKEHIFCDELQFLSNEIKELKQEREALLVELNVAREDIRTLHLENKSVRAYSESLRTQIMELSHHVKMISCGIAQDPFYWYLTPYERLLSPFKACGGVHVLYSEAFYSDVPGYRFRLRLMIDIPSKTVLLTPQLLPGQFNNILNWPFKPNYVMRLADQSSAQKHIEVTVSGGLPETLEKPPESGRLLSCSALQVPMTVLEDPDSGYLINDTVIFLFQMKRTG